MESQTENDDRQMSTDLRFQEQMELRRWEESPAWWE